MLEVETYLPSVNLECSPCDYWHQKIVSGCYFLFVLSTVSYIDMSPQQLRFKRLACLCVFQHRQSLPLLLLLISQGRYCYFIIGNCAPFAGTIQFQIRGTIVTVYLCYLQLSFGCTVRVGVWVCILEYRVQKTFCAYEAKDLIAYLFKS